MIDEMSHIKRVQTFYGELDKPIIVESFTLGSEQAMQIEQLYKLKERYSQVNAELLRNPLCCKVSNRII